MDPSLWYQNPWYSPSNSPQQWGGAKLFTTNYFSSEPSTSENPNVFLPSFPSPENPNIFYQNFPTMPTCCSVGLSPQAQHRFSPRSQYRVKKRKNSKSSTDIPVNFRDSEVKVNVKVKAKRSSWQRQQMSEATAAVKIQKAFRGFSLRRTKPLKNLKKIAEVKAITDGIRKRINDQEFVEFIRLNEEEGVKVLVRLVSLLLRLDLMQAVNTFVRESRKAMVLEIMKLKEIVDAIVRENPIIEAEAESSNVALKIMKLQKITDAIVRKKPNEAESESTKNDEEFTLPKEMIALDLQAARSNVSSPCTHLNSTRKKIMLCHKQSCECLNDLSEHVKDSFNNVLKDEKQAGSDIPQANNKHNKEDAHNIECFTEIGMVTQDVTKLQSHGIFNADLDVGKIKDEGDSDDWEFLEKPEDGSVDMMEELRGENKLKKFTEELYSRDKIQSDIIEDISKMFKKLQKMMLRSAEDKTD